MASKLLLLRSDVFEDSFEGVSMTPNNISS